MLECSLLNWKVGCSIHSRSANRCSAALLNIYCNMADEYLFDIFLGEESRLW